jgi:glutathione S-transferase
MALVTLSYRRSGSPELLALRMALAAKGIKCELKHVPTMPEGAAVVLSEPHRNVHCPEFCSTLEYIDERFPEPPLMPIDPASRMRIRAVVSRISSVFSLSIGDQKVAEVLAAIDAMLTAGKTGNAGAPWLIAQEMTLADCAAVAFLQTKVTNGALLKTARKANEYMRRFEQHEESAKRVGIGFFDNYTD